MTYKAMVINTADDSCEWREMVVTNGDSHDHSGGDGAQVNHTTLSNIGTNTHAQIDSHIGTGSHVTNGDTHDHSGGDGAQINHTTLSNIGTNTHAQIDTHVSSAVHKRIVELKVLDDATALTTGDGKLIFCIPSDLNSYLLTDADAFVTTVSSSGAPTVMLRNVTDTQDMLSTAITIDANEYTSYTAATAPAINATYDDVATGDLLAVDIDGAGTGAKGLGVILVFGPA